MRRLSGQDRTFGQTFDHDPPPLAERMRPGRLDEFAGQQHLVGQGAVIRQAVESGHLPSMIFWGPPGVGKTTLARLIASETGRTCIALSAIQSGVKEIRQSVTDAESQIASGQPSPSSSSMKSIDSTRASRMPCSGPSKKARSS